MFQKGRYLLAIMLFSTFVFRILFLDMVILTSFSTSQAKNLAVNSYKRIYKRRKSECVHTVKTNVTSAEVSEEAVEDDDTENLEKGSKYPSLLLSFLYCFRGLPDKVNLQHLTELIHTKQSSRTYLSISVLRI